MAHFVNPFTDIGFKIIFGQPASKELLITNVNDRGIIFDLYCLTSSGEYIIVEMQNRWHSNFLDRTLYYVQGREVRAEIPYGHGSGRP